LRGKLEWNAMQMKRRIEPMPVALNPEQRAILDALAAAGGPMRASVLFARAAAAVGGADVQTLAAEARKLQALRLLKQQCGRSPYIELALCRRGRRLVRGQRRRNGAAVVAAALASPALMSCALLHKPQAPVEQRYEARPLPRFGAQQSVRDGVAVWSVCSGAQCEQPTPKHPAFGAAAPVPRPAAQAAAPAPLPAVRPAAPPAVQPPPAPAPDAASSSPRSDAREVAPRVSAYSLFFSTGKDEPFAADLGYIEAAAQSAKLPGARVAIVGMTT
jgi:hypothetical protein